MIERRLSPRAYRGALLLLLLVAFALRMARVGELRMWGDEAYSVYSADRSLYAITFEGAEDDPHPPLYYYLLHFYMPLAGASESALRFFSIFPGVATLALVYAIGRRTVGRRAALLAVAWGAIAPFHIFYSQEIRMYALAIFLTALALYFFVRLWQAPEGASPRGLWLGYALAMLLALYTLYHAAFVLLAEGMALLPLLRTPRRRFVLRWFALGVSLVVLFLPWLLLRFSTTLGHLVDRAGGRIQPLQVFIARGFAALVAGTTIPLTNAFIFTGIALVFVLLGLAFAWRRQRLEFGDGLLILLAVVPITAVYPLYMLLPILVGRLFALAFVPLVLVIARAVTHLPGKLVPTAAIVCLAGVSAVALNDYYFRYDRYNAQAEDYIPAIQAVEEHARPGDVVLFHAYWQIGYFLSHYHGPPLEYRMLDRMADLQQAVGAPRNVWAIVQDVALHGAEPWLAQHAFYLNEQTFGRMRLISYRAGTPGQSETYSTPILFENGLALLGYAVNSEPVESGRGVVTVQLNWQATRAIPADYKVSVRLTTASLGMGPRSGTIWAQEDGEPAYGTVPTSNWEAGQVVEDRHTLAVPAGMPPGSYTVQIVVYESASGRPANVVAPEAARTQVFSLGRYVQIGRPAVAVPAPPIPHPLEVAWGDLALAGIETSADEVGQGDALPLTLYWEALRKPEREAEAWIRLVDAAGNVHDQLLRPASETFSTREWQAGDLWVDRLHLDIAANTATGDALVLIGLVSGVTGEVIAPSSPLPVREVEIQAPITHTPARLQAVQVARVRITGRVHHFDFPSPTHPLQGKLGDTVQLLGYDLNSDTYPAGTTILLRLYWQALAPMHERYTVFAQVIDPAGDLIAQRDSEPAGGLAPTTSWVPGEVITDEYQIPLPNTLVLGEYTIQVGLYDAATGRRLALTAPQGGPPDYIVLGKMQVTAP